MQAYSQDLRQRILDTVQRGEGSLRQIARRFLVSISFVTRLLHLHRSTGWLQPKPHGGGNPAVLGPEDLGAAPELVRQQPDATLEELPSGPAPCSLITISPARERTAAEKEDPPRLEQDRPEVQERRQEFCAELAGVDPRRLVFVDESGANTAMTRTHGRAPVGQRVSTNTPGHWDSITLTCGLRLLRGDAAVGLSGCHQYRHLRELRGGGVGPAVEARRRGHLGQSQAAPVGGSDRGRRGLRPRVEPLPPWSPDLTPIEEMISKVKGAMRTAAARTTDAVYAAFASALQDVTPEDIAGWFRDRAAYAMRL